MIWIHGGAYHSGYSQGYTGWKVATEQNIVVVVIQYRLGALGFLSSGDDFLPGNYGLWDQLLALKWVKDNIRGFGGDVSMITIVGESAGASSVSQHTVSRHSSGLFHRAVMMSGTVEAYWCFRRNPRATFDRMSKVAGCGENSTSQESRLDCLMKVPADDIHSAAVATEAGDFVTFVPVIDGNFFPNDLHNLLKDEDYLSSVGFYDYDVLMGVLNNEGVITFTTLITLSPTVLATGRVPYQDIDGVLLDGLMLQEQGENHDPNSKDAVNYRYFYPRDPAESSVPLRTFFDLYTDSSFAAPAVKYLRNHARRDGMSKAGAVSTPTPTPTTAAAQSPRQSKSYFYYFDWVPSLTRGSLFAGMPHGLDVDYLFGLTNASLARYGPMTPHGIISQQEHDLSRMYGDMIGAFVRTGNPNNGISPSFNLGNQWLPYDVSKETFLRFSPTPSIDHHLRPSTTSLWVDLVPRLHSRWLQQTANGIPGPTATEIPGPTATEKTPTAERSQSEKLTDFNVTASEANAMLISLIIVSAVLLLLNLFLLVIFIRVCRRKTASKYEMKNMDRSHNNN
ncbi:neuroligin-4, Y-linked-like [Littorina saxatilis]|uniref:Carboxylic ester hydrolase n=1 Tax=Littorina saxatilis TaxID=31220 RepID=A0AAN9ALI9_9CAEN